MHLFPFHSWRIFLLDIEFGLIVLSFGTWKMCHCLLTFMVSSEQSTVIRIVSPLGKGLLLISLCFQDLFFSLVFSFLTRMTWCGFLWVYPVWEPQPLKSVYIFCLYLLGDFSHILSLLSFLNCDNMNVKSFVRVPQVFENLFTFLRLLSVIHIRQFLLFFLQRHGIFPLLSPFCYWVHSLSFCISFVVSFSSKISI